MTRRNRNKILIIMAAIALALAMPVVLCIGTALIVGFPAVPIPPQDCQLIRRSIMGQVLDAHENPIANADIHIQNEGGADFEGGHGHVDLLLHSATNGEFGQENVSVFGCDTLKFDVSAAKYQAQETSYDVQKVYDTPTNIEIVLHLVSS
ncbi:MAG TPA: hypothetical protein VKQ72_18960 [Aggregatilineales bacterium]|nr:hypothetical protein [Aggregatilineales bacterium]